MMPQCVTNLELYIHTASDKIGRPNTDNIAFCCKSLSNLALVLKCLPPSVLVLLSIFLEPAGIYDSNPDIP